MRAVRDLKQRSRPASAPARQLRLPNKQMRALQDYNATKVNRVVENMMTALFIAQPQDPVDFMLSWLSAHRAEGVGEKQQMLRRLNSIAPTLELPELAQVVSAAEGAARVSNAGGDGSPAAASRPSSARPSSARPAPARSTDSLPSADKPPRRIILAGAPASGKGTQCELVCAYYGLRHISTGGLIRDARAAGTDAGLAAQQALEQRLSVPDETLIKIVVDALRSDNFKDHGWLMDGFPRTQAQAAALRDAGVTPDIFVVLDIADEVCHSTSLSLAVVCVWIVGLASQSSAA